ncbi:hypothetical protein B5X24_HaOG215543 [Helicoverpa armigera]|nr:hypothetical protein B5X24_HaOG215543 [Helicoverpa armigera]
MIYKYLYFSLFICVFLICCLQAEEEEMDNGTDGKSMKKLMKIPPPPFITYGPFPFEGVDYDLLPKPTYDYYYDCYYLHTKCVRDRVYDNEVCSYSKSKGWVNFATQCELDLQNCLARVKSKLGMYGTTMKDDTYFYNGDGWDCKYARRSGSRISFYSEEEENVFLEEIRNITAMYQDNATENTLELHIN